MEAPETAALRNLLDQYLAGWEPPDTVAPHFVSHLGAWFEASYQSTLRGEPALADFMPPDLTSDQHQRIRELMRAVLHCLPDTAPVVEWLPVDKDEAV